jgi:hypothetical protein
VEENYESREKREIGNFWRGKLRLARFADRDRTAEQPSYGFPSAAEPQPNSSELMKTERGISRKTGLSACGGKQQEQIQCSIFKFNIQYSSEDRASEQRSEVRRQGRAEDGGPV